jgi:hypothetical protein
MYTFSSTRIQGFTRRVENVVDAILITSLSTPRVNAANRFELEIMLVLEWLRRTNARIDVRERIETRFTSFLFLRNFRWRELTPL